MSMKKIYLVIIFSLLLFGCGKDDFAPDKGNCTYDGKIFSLDKGFIRCEYFDEYWSGQAGEDAPYEYDVFLTSSSISWSDNQESFVGNGNWILFELNTDKEGLAEGTYNLGGYSSYTIASVDFETVGNPDSYGGFECYSGSVDITRNGNIYKFDFTFRTEENKILKGVFEGPLTTLKQEVW